jgi:hypothetical protein
MHRSLLSAVLCLSVLLSPLVAAQDTSYTFTTIDVPNWGYLHDPSNWCIRCSGLQTVRRGLANKGHFRLTFRANRPAYEPTLTANEPTLGSWPVLVTSKVNRGCSPLPCA